MTNEACLTERAHFKAPDVPEGRGLFLSNFFGASYNDEPAVFTNGLFYIVELQRRSDIIRQLCETADSAMKLLIKRLNM